MSELSRKEKKLLKGLFGDEYAEVERGWKEADHQQYKKSHNADGLFDAVEKAMLKEKRNAVYRFMSDLSEKEEERLDKILDHDDIYYSGTIIGFLDLSKGGNLSDIYLVTTNGIYSITYTIMEKHSSELYEFDKKNKCVRKKKYGDEVYKYGDKIESNSFFGAVDQLFAPIINAVLEYFETSDRQAKAKKAETLESFDYDD